MKNFLLKILLFSLLIGSVQHFYGATSRAITTSKETSKHVLKPARETSTSLDVTEFDLEEDHQTADDFQDNSTSASVLVAATWEQWLRSIAILLTAPVILKPQQIGPHFGYTTPIYLSHRVLRL